MQSYRRTAPILATVEVVNGLLDGNRGFVDVKWDGTTVMMFTTDIRERCVRSEDV